MHATSFPSFMPCLVLSNSAQGRGWRLQERRLGRRCEMDDVTCLTEDYGLVWQLWRWNCASKKGVARRVTSRFTISGHWTSNSNLASLTSNLSREEHSSSNRDLTHLLYFFLLHSFMLEKIPIVFIFFLLLPSFHPRYKWWCSKDDELEPIFFSPEMNCIKKGNNRNETNVGKQ